MQTIKLPPLPELPRLMHGDCLALMREIPTGSVDMILCDLPYGTTACCWDSVIPFAPLWEQYKRIAKPNAAIVLTGSQPFTSALIQSCIDLFRYELIWHKGYSTGYANANKIPMKGHENICIFYKKLPTYNPQGLQVINKPARRGATDIALGANGLHSNIYTQKFTNYPTSIISTKKESRTVHPTQKPVALMEYLIRTYTNEGQTVLDNCMGSGTTGVACRNTNRKFIGIEQDAKYFAIAHERILNADF